MGHYPRLFPSVGRLLDRIDTRNRFPSHCVIDLSG
ncbi:hypothetical protein FB005_1628 [Sinorhizobium medicae]|nr:hypothetical protein FB006_1652 [Sinorhizobium medicae]TWA24009.1 hypothetical protein FB007_1431 [Sinorhizobium medicae]TWA32602.1 hypothetical protein FB005_1628 [Sinorhizobium medicae]